MATKAEGARLLAENQAAQQRQLAAEDGRAWEPEEPVHRAPTALSRRPPKAPEAQYTPGSALGLCVGLAAEGRALLRNGLIEQWASDSGPAEAALAFLRHYNETQDRTRYRQSKHERREEREEFEAYIFEAVSVYPQPKNLYQDLAAETGKTVGQLRTIVHRIRKNRGIEVRGPYRT